MQINIKQYDLVRITALHRKFTKDEVIGSRLPVTGDKAAVLDIFQHPRLGYELESTSADGDTNWLITVSIDDLDLEVIGHLSI